MLGLKNASFPTPISSFSRPKFTFPSCPLQTHIKIPKIESRFLLFALNNNNSQEPNKQKQEKLNGSADNGGGGDDLKEDRPPLLKNIKWGELLLDPDPDNIVAVGLTGLLAWASAQVLWQLFLVSAAILIAALKYSFIAALLIFILITLL
ncbi:hypothetical protein P3X46_025298 [Hevea brasiliensis]|uniref:Transmembrane protein n=1 Tax=Hevea brasiliensis TaxID=3981 RepID=A0ABQ9L542_HEVBR|nr:uncharacterized protein LOC110633881 [Hevea brasiliensis]KAJ9159834.1 hypothetical protein P3X46_025298 [Hevea brasiliensis]